MTFGRLVMDLWPPTIHQTDVQYGAIRHIVIEHAAWTGPRDIHKSPSSLPFRMGHVSTTSGSFGQL